MRYFFLFFIAISVSLQAQQSKAIVDLAVPEAYTFKLTALEKEMYLHARKMIDDTIEKSRLNHCYELIKTLKTALKIPNSFYHDFSDTIPGMIELRSPDNRFKMFTIQLEGRNTQYRHFGAIQFASSELKFLPLIDYSDTFDLTPQIPLNQKNWYGSLYYKAIPKQIGKKTIYFLLGYDKNNYFSSKKIVEPLEIISEREVLFGGLYFNLNTNLNQDEKSDLTPKNMMKNDKAKGTFPKTKGETKTKEVYRFVLEYMENATVTLNFDEEKNAILFDHLVSTTQKGQDLNFTKAPDGTYESLVWRDNKWHWVKMAKIAEQESNAPIRPVPLKLQKIPKDE